MAVAYLDKKAVKFTVKNLRQLCFASAKGLVLCFTVWSCTSVEELPAPTGMFSVEGEMIGTAVPERAGATVLWEGEFVSGDGYIFGKGQTLGNDFIISIPNATMKVFPAGPLIAEDRRYAVGRIFAVLGPPPVAGPKEANDLLGQGYSARHAIIYREARISGPYWLNDFPVGFSCGTCARGSPRDRWVPVPCDSFEVWTSNDWSTFPFCAW